MSQNLNRCLSCPSENFVAFHSGTQVSIEAPNPSYTAVKAIWRDKIGQYELFLPEGLDDILTIWIKFIPHCLRYIPSTDAEEFYVETAEIAAQKLKNFENHGWDCLTIEFPLDYNCSENNLVQKNTGDSFTSSARSTSDILEMVELLLQMVASSNFNLQLIKTALDSSFEPSYVELNSPQVVMLPKKYLEVKDLKKHKTQIRKDVLNGVYDEYILPLQICNEVNDEFWSRMQKQTIAK